MKKFLRVYRQKRVKATLKLDDRFALVLDEGTIECTYFLIHVLIFGFSYHVKRHIVTIPDRHRTGVVVIPIDLTEVRLPGRRRHGDCGSNRSTLSLL